ncbi:hypothetical protein DYI25_03415 [Mesobacillus boroniphilus]|uniref:Coupling factor for flagellin transcription and translation n=1 Tax=Mesobacillus boroniphilus TaxID=308892 RepID=A0A944CI94_9BACI|nr:hypothetical protein [Mesobacillus boroniphilus]MBS8263488.1 hypothetical protein [Mesobacillus boroniphilus]
MTTFLLLLSLILNAAAIFAIILLYLRQNRLVEAEKKQGKIINEIEEIFSAYLFELKEENDKFLELMTKTKFQKQQGNIESTAIDAAGEETETDSGHITQAKQQNRLGKGISYHTAKKAYQQNREAVPPDLHLPEDDKIDIDSQLNPVEPNQLSFIDQVLHMKKQGLTIEEIARDLDKGKTEIELLLKFRQNTQE